MQRKRCRWWFAHSRTEEAVTTLVGLALLNCRVSLVGVGSVVTLVRCVGFRHTDCARCRFLALLSQEIGQGDVPPEYFCSSNTTPKALVSNYLTEASYRKYDGLKVLALLISSI